jgi:hypothetical protein
MRHAAILRICATLGKEIPNRLEFVGGLGFSSANSLSNAVSWLTDGTDQLRHVATEDIKPPIKARRETSEEEYLAFMRARFGSKRWNLQLRPS